jgi:hypothetical protein
MLTYNDKKLNIEQNFAVNQVLSRTENALTQRMEKEPLMAPFIIHGPAGTGKTSTLVEIILEVVKNYPESRILVTAPSESAADTVAMKLVTKGMTPSQVFRFNDKLRDITTLPASLLHVSNINGQGKFGLPSIPVFCSYNVIVCTFFECGILNVEGYSNDSLGKMRKEYLSNVNNGLKLLGIEVGANIEIKNYQYIFN